MHLARLGGGLVGAAMLAVAVPATTGAGPFGSAAPRPAQAASSCNDTKAVTKQSGGQQATAKIPANRGSTNCLLGPGNRQGGVRTLQLALNGIYGPQTAKAMKWPFGRDASPPVQCEQLGSAR
jgi:hypothetical protein